MTTLNASQIYAYARQAGFSGVAAIQATAVALAESGGRTDVIGDRNLTQAGEKSVGLWQINYRPSRDAGNSERDPSANLDPSANAAAAYAISNRGTNFSPWSTYTSGAYRSFLPKALAAAASAGDPVPAAADFAKPGDTSSSTTADTSSSDSGSSSSNPFALNVGGPLGGVITGLGKLVLPTIAVLGGVALVAGGVYKAVTAKTGKPSLPPAAMAAAL